MYMIRFETCYFVLFINILYKVERKSACFTWRTFGWVHQMAKKSDEKTFCLWNQAAMAVVYIVIDTVNIVANAARRQNERKLIKGQSLCNKLANFMQRFPSKCPRRKNFVFSALAPTISQQIDFMKFSNKILNIYSASLWLNIELNENFPPIQWPLIVWFVSLENKYRRLYPSIETMINSL